MPKNRRLSGEAAVRFREETYTSTPKRQPDLTLFAPARNASDTHEKGTHRVPVKSARRCIPASPPCPLLLGRLSICEYIFIDAQPRSVTHLSRQAAKFREETQNQRISASRLSRPICTSFPIMASAPPTGFMSGNQEKKQRREGAAKVRGVCRGGNRPSARRHMATIASTDKLCVAKFHGRSGHWKFVVFLQLYRSDIRTYDRPAPTIAMRIAWQLRRCV